MLKILLVIAAVFWTLRLYPEGSGAKPRGTATGSRPGLLGSQAFISQSISKNRAR